MPLPREAHRPQKYRRADHYIIGNFKPLALRQIHAAGNIRWQRAAEAHANAMPIFSRRHVLYGFSQPSTPNDAKEQARGYAENLKAPFVLLSNGREHWFWNYERDAYRIERLPSCEDLQRARLKNLQPPRPLQTDGIRPEYLRNLRPDRRILRCVDTRSAPSMRSQEASTIWVAENSCLRWQQAPARHCFALL
jgi:hypothetical protein